MRTHETVDIGLAAFNVFMFYVKYVAMFFTYHFSKTVGTMDGPLSAWRKVKRVACAVGCFAVLASFAAQPHQTSDDDGGPTPRELKAPMNWTRGLTLFLGLSVASTFGFWEGFALSDAIGVEIKGRN